MRGVGNLRRVQVLINGLSGHDTNCRASDALVGSNEHLLAGCHEPWNRGLFGRSSQSHNGTDHLASDNNTDTELMILGDAAER